MGDWTKFGDPNDLDDRIEAEKAFLIRALDSMKEQFVQEEEPTQSQKDCQVYNSLMTAYSTLIDSRPDDRSERSRRYAIAITEMQKLIAWADMWICRNGP